MKRYLIQDCSHKLNYRCEATRFIIEANDLIDLNAQLNFQEYYEILAVEDLE